jgi:MFS family permease
MAVVFTLASSTITVLITNFVPILADQGVAPTRAAAIAGTFGIAVIVGRVIVGALIDRIWAPVVGFILFVPAAAATWMLGTGLDVQWTIVAIFVAGFAAGAEVDLMGYMVARYFGLAHYGKIYAGLYIGFALGPAIATPLFGGARDALGSYEYPLYFASTGVFIAALLLLSLGPYPDRKRVSAAT